MRLFFVARQEAPRAKPKAKGKAKTEPKTKPKMQPKPKSSQSAKAKPEAKPEASPPPPMKSLPKKKTKSNTADSGDMDWQCVKILGHIDYALEVIVVRCCKGRGKGKSKE